MNNDTEPLRIHIERRSQAIAARVLEEANARTFLTPEKRTQWIDRRMFAYTFTPEFLWPDTKDTSDE